MIRLEISKSAHLYKIILFTILSLAFLPNASFAIKDKVYFRVETDYYSGWELRKNENRIRYFACLNSSSSALDVLRNYYDSKFVKKKSLNELIELKLDNTLKYYEPVNFYLTLFKLTKFLKGHSIVLSQNLLKNIKDQIKISDCSFSDQYEKDPFIAIKSFYQLEIFLKSRFNLNIERGKFNYRSAFNFLDSIDGQYRHEFFY